MPDNIKYIFFIVCLSIIGLVILACFVFAIRLKRVSDRMISINMIGTQVIFSVAILSVVTGEGYLADICLIYSMVSFLTVVLLAKVYIGEHIQKKHEKEEHKDE